MSEPVTPAQEGQEVPISLPKLVDPWSRLATANNSSRSVNELLAKAGLKGWNVRPEPMVTLAGTDKCVECGRPLGQKHGKDCDMAQPAEGQEDYDGTVDDNDVSIEVDAPGIWGLVRTDPKTGDLSTIGTIQRQSKPDSPVPIETRGSILAEIAKEGKGKFGAAGPLWSNTAAFATVKLPESIPVGKVDALEMRVVLVNSLVPGKPSQLVFVPVRPTTATVQPFADMPRMNLQAEDSADARLTEASEGLDLARQYAELAKTQATKMLRKKMSATAFEAVCEGIWPKPGPTTVGFARKLHEDRLARLKLMFEGKLDLFAGIGGTHWGAWQAILTWAQHLPVLPDEDAESVTYRAELALFGRFWTQGSEAYTALAV